jgi:outer membrane protein assembly factor BamE (lipoprotein component of BamABCDE complex)
MRMFGLFLLTLSISLSSCQAFVDSLPSIDFDRGAVVDQRDINRHP